MNRRSFFAAVLAPLVARWMPKPKPGAGWTRVNENWIAVANPEHAVRIAS